jgi:hypothetical protein
VEERFREPGGSSLDEGESNMTLGVAHLSPVLSIIVGVLILIMPRFLNYFVAIYLIVIGLLGLGVGR